MRTMSDIVEQLRSNYRDQVRAIIERDDQTILLAYLEAQGFLSLEAIEKLNVEAATGRGVYFDWLASNHFTPRQAREFNDADAVAMRADYGRYLTTPEGMKALDAERVAKAKADSDAALAAEAAKEKEIKDANAAEDKLAADNAAAAKTVEDENAKAASVAAKAEAKSMGAAKVEQAKGTPGSGAPAGKQGGTMTSKDTIR